jgi:ABC-type uncharacterized transport system substrate-binding protein
MCVAKNLVSVRLCSYRIFGYRRPGRPRVCKKPFAPGGNITGISFDATANITAKQVQLLIEIVSGIDRVAVPWNPTSPFLRSYWEVARSRGPNLGVALDSFEVQESRQFESTFDAIKSAHAGALIVLSDSFLLSCHWIGDCAAGAHFPQIGHSVRSKGSERVP